MVLVKNGCIVCVVICQKKHPELVQYLFQHTSCKTNSEMYILTVVSETINSLYCPV
uniref:Uncharacterized protein n=1 Tax=Octopus bimaculoides TaxID=37653 RepID=A0A0L8FGR2_OCTBM